jgi:acyl-CoA dehydrogenase
VRAAGLLRRALTEALHVARHRSAFGRRLVELPLMRRQLLKLMLPAEAARSLFLYAAACLERADAGDAEAARRLRIVTPLLKFRACRDARKVTGDAMEVRGGVGYIEEWAEPRLVRDAHLGSIWEGTSNIVALDAMRAIRREESGAALAADLRRRLDAAARRDPGLVGRLAPLLERAVAFAEAAARDGDERSARQAASGLYYAAAATLLAEEGTRLAAAGDARRLRLAGLVLRHRLAPRDPLQAAEPDEDEFAEALLGEAPVP